MDVKIKQETASVFTIKIKDLNDSLNPDRVKTVAGEHFRQSYSKEIEEIFSTHISPSRRYAEISIRA